MNGLLFTFWVSNACNLRCKYCYEGTQKNNMLMSQKTALDSIKFVIRTLKENNAKKCRIAFHGGEPTLNMPIIKYIIKEFSKYTEQYSFFYSMTTNGYSISDEDITFISKNIDDLTVSIDGNKESHDLNRITYTGTGSYDIVVDTAKKLNENKDIRIRMTVNSTNSNMLYKNVVSLTQNGFEVIVPGIDYGDSNWEHQLFQDLENQFEKIRMYIQKNDHIYVSSMSTEEIAKKTPCDGCINSFHIAVDGNLYPCIYVVDDSEFCMGNIYDGIHQEILNKYNKINLMPVSVCEGCNYYDYCPSKRCKYINKKLTGDYLTPSPIVCATENLLLKVSKLIR